MSARVEGRGGVRKSTGAPEISVVIPTWRRETRLAFALEALAAQTLDRDRFEVIVVRAEGGVDGELTVAPPQIQATFLVSPTAGPAAQRNMGWRAARAPLVAFTDDDCRPASDWLERLLEASGENRFLQGRTEPDPDERHLLWGLARSWDISELKSWYATCNMAYPRALLEELGGFDESFRYPWGEDTDLGLRAREAGGEPVYVDGALAWHAVLPRSVPAAMREAARREATAAVIARHPVHREELYLGIFAHKRHAKLLLALLAAVALRRRPLFALLGAIPYLKQFYPWTLAPRRMARGTLHLPVRVAVDLAEIGVAARAGIKHRVVFL